MASCSSHTSVLANPFFAVKIDILQECHDFADRASLSISKCPSKWSPEESNEAVAWVSTNCAD